MPAATAHGNAWDPLLAAARAVPMRTNSGSPAERVGSVAAGLARVRSSTLELQAAELVYIVAMGVAKMDGL